MGLFRRSPLGHVFALRSSSFLTTAARAGADLGKTARKAASARRDRVLPQAGNIPGGGVKGAAQHKPNDAVIFVYSRSNSGT